MKMKHRIFGFALSVLLLAVFSGCATMFRTNAVEVVAASGAAAHVRVLENGILIYEGTLPATFPVQSGRTYTITYTDADGESRTVVLQQRFNGWTIGSIFLGFFPVVIDLVTGSIMTFESTKVLPISFSPMIMLGENISESPGMVVIGNLNDYFTSMPETHCMMWFQ